MSDHYSLLGVSRDATNDEIAIAFRQLARQRFQELGSEARLDELSRAYRTISSLERRREYDRTMYQLSGKFVQVDPAGPTAAETDYYAGLEAMEKQNYQLAVDKFTQAVAQEPEQSHFHSQLGLALGMFRDRLAEAEQYCKKAIELDADNPELYYNLGFLYQRHNLNDAAQEAFSQAQEALVARQVRLGIAAPATIEVTWHEDRPVATFSGIPGASGAVTADAPAGDLLQELASLESSFSQSEDAAAVQAPANPSPTAPPPDVRSPDDLLKELESIEAQVSQSENGAVASNQPETPAVAASQQEQVVLDAVKQASRQVTVDDLLKELEEMEAQVNRSAAAEEAANETDAQVAEAFATSGAAPAAAPPQPDIYQQAPETQAAEDAETIAEQADQLLKEFGTGPEPLPLEPVQPEVAPTATSDSEPEPEEPLQLETAAIEQPSVPSSPAPSVTLSDESSVIPIEAAIAVEPEPQAQPQPAVEPEPEIPPLVISRDDGHGEPLDPEVQDKVKQLETLESEMEEELQRLRNERKKLLKKKK